PLTRPLIDCQDISGTDCYCDEIAEEEIKSRLTGIGPEGIHFLDSGNYHYLTLFFLQKLPEDQPFELILFDNHPDSKEPAFGDILSCGGWVRKAWEKVPGLLKITMIGMDPLLLKEEGLKPGRNSLKRRPDLSPLIIECYPSGQNIDQSPDHSPSIIECYPSGQNIDQRKDHAYDLPVYISIDKDVLRVEDARCNWSQGNMSKEELLEMVSEIYRIRRVLGMDICGEEDRKDLTEGTKQNEKRNQELAELPRGCHFTAKSKNA
ncbi:MAG: hypothetical protein PUC75_07535, partial [Lachnospiraceae bacterium]|nr:hypothetical protein [Lachnospiraceae bacterium]